mmetsp:Transcript_149366/g.271922  ORF Transcript_149366/g.271922 Transcript_149366/m.271922 type:complete len:143 (-) Transcript_149366:90-518(-)
MLWVQLIALTSFASLPSIPLGCDDCSGLPKWTEDISGDGIVNEDDDPCCYPHTWSLKLCMCEDEYERRHGTPKPEEEMEKPLYLIEDGVEPPRIIVHARRSFQLSELWNFQWCIALACCVGVLIFVRLLSWILSSSAKDWTS